MARRRSSPWDALSPEARSRLERRAMPRWTEPMLATLTDEPFSDPNWIFERKLDGVRCLAFHRRGSVRIRSRTRQDMNGTWPELVEALEAKGNADYVVDGEIVAFRGARTSFERLQGRLGVLDPERARGSGIAVHLYLFDILHWDGCDTTLLALRDRKRVLRRAIRFRDPLRFTPHRNRDGEAWLGEACRKGWEGLIAKDARAPYVHGRSRLWRKLKCVQSQELVIGGFTEPRGSRRGFGALLVGYYEDGALRYAGKVGTGYDDDLLQRLGRRLRALERKRSPFADSARERGAHWVAPVFVAEVGFTEWTRDGKLRHPRFLGLRSDKPPQEVVRERPA